MSDSAHSETTRTFTMHGCREVMMRTVGAAMFEQQMLLLERSVYDNPQIAFDTSRTLIETACKTILIDCGQRPSENGQIQQLFRDTLGALSIMPNSHATLTELEQAIKDTLTTLENTVVNIGRVRNKGGFVSHGRDGYALPLQETTHAQFVARTTDAIIHFLYSLHWDSGGQRAKPMAYIDNPDFNQHVDELYADLNITLFDTPFVPSEILFSDPIAYRDALSRYRADPGSLNS